MCNNRNGAKGRLCTKDGTETHSSAESFSTIEGIRQLAHTGIPRCPILGKIESNLMKVEPMGVVLTEFGITVKAHVDRSETRITTKSFKDI